MPGRAISPGTPNRGGKPRIDETQPAIWPDQINGARQQIQDHPQPRRGLGAHLFRTRPLGNLRLQAPVPDAEDRERSQNGGDRRQDPGQHDRQVQPLFELPFLPAGGDGVERGGVEIGPGHAQNAGQHVVVRQHRQTESDVGTARKAGQLQIAETQPPDFPARHRKLHRRNIRRAAGNRLQCHFGGGPAGHRQPRCGIFEGGLHRTAVDHCDPPPEQIARRLDRGGFDPVDHHPGGAGISGREDDAVFHLSQMAEARHRIDPSFIQQAARFSRAVGRHEIDGETGGGGKMVQHVGGDTGMAAMAIDEAQGRGGTGGRHRQHPMAGDPVGLTIIQTRLRRIQHADRHRRQPVAADLPMLFGRQCADARGQNIGQWRQVAGDGD